MNDPLIIAVGYKKGAGKDTIANRLVDAHGFIRLSFADPLKEACRLIFHFNDAQLYGDQKEVIDKNWDKTPREIFQTLGTDAIRNVLDSNVWVKSCLLKIKKMTLQYPNQQLKFVIPDCRFLNEIETLKSIPNTYIWKVNRNLVSNIFSNHLSETELDTFTQWDAVLENNSSMQSLYKKVDEQINSIVNKENYTYGRRKEKSS